jgi:hypothetical protein
VAATGYAVDWISAMLAYGSAPAYNMGPSRVFGVWWLAIGLPLAAWMTLKCRVGWAGLAISPYVLPQYLMWPLVELPERREQPAQRHEHG